MQQELCLEHISRLTRRELHSLSLLLIKDNLASCVEQPQIMREGFLGGHFVADLTEEPKLQHDLLNFSRVVRRSRTSMWQQLTN